jgi:hypothetical protein
MLLAMQKPDATRVAGFKAWLALGYCVRRGEKALRIYAPCPPSKAKLEAWRRAGGDPADKPRTFFRLTAVFDFSQVDELPPPAHPAPLEPPAAAEIDGTELALLACAADRPRRRDRLQCCVRGDFFRRRRLLPPAHEGDRLEASHPANRQPPSQDARARARARARQSRPPAQRPAARRGRRGARRRNDRLERLRFQWPGPRRVFHHHLASWSEHTPTATIEATAALIDRLSRRIEDAIADVELATPSPSSLATTADLAP